MLFIFMCLVVTMVIHPLNIYIYILLTLRIIKISTRCRGDNGDSGHVDSGGGGSDNTDE